MGKPVAKEGDKIVGVDTHIVMVSSPAGPVPTPSPSPFSGKLARSLAASVYVDGRQAAINGSEADNSPNHIPIGGSFQRAPSNVGKISSASGTVLAGGVGIARMGDPATCCNDLGLENTGSVVATGTTVFSG